MLKGSTKEVAKYLLEITRGIQIGIQLYIALCKPSVEIPTDRLIVGVIHKSQRRLQKRYFSQVISMITVSAAFVGKNLNKQIWFSIAQGCMSFTLAALKLQAMISLKSVINVLLATLRWILLLKTMEKHYRKVNQVPMKHATQISSNQLISDYHLVKFTNKFFQSLKKFKS